MGEPRDGEAFAASGRMLDQVVLARAILICAPHETAHAIELLVARENQLPFPSIAAMPARFLDFMDKSLDQIQHAVARPGFFP